MSYLSENAKYKLVMFDANKNICDSPFYSLPHYEKKGTAKQKLVQRFVKGRYKNKHKFAFIYDNFTGNIIELYINGILQNKKLEKTHKTYGKNISLLKIWILFKNKATPLTRYSITEYDKQGEEQSYWHLINTYIKGNIRNRIKYAEIYRIVDNKRIGRILLENGKLKGLGIYHKIKEYENNN